MALTKQSDRFSETRIDDEIVIMLLDSGEFLSLTGTAVSIWSLIDGTRDRQGLVAELAREYAVEGDDIAADVDEFLASLRDAGLVAES